MLRGGSFTAGNLSSRLSVLPEWNSFLTNSISGASATFVVRTGSIRPRLNCCMTPATWNSCGPRGTSGRRRGSRGISSRPRFPARRMPAMHIPDHIDGKAGWYAMATETSITSRHLGGCAGLLRLGAVGPASCRIRRGRERVCTVPAARPSRHEGHVRRLLLSQQCRGRRADVPDLKARRGWPCSTWISITETERRTSSMIDRMSFSCPCTAIPFMRFPYFSGHAEETGDR